MKLASLVFVAMVFPCVVLGADAPPIPLWPNGAPGFESRKDEKEIRDRQNNLGEYRLTNVHNPYITAFIPS